MLGAFSLGTVRAARAARAASNEKNFLPVVKQRREKTQFKGFDDVRL